jgi:hypothetical protein
MFFVIYIPVIRSEENFLREKFPEFADYARRVPRIVPRVSAAESAGGAGEFSSELYLRHREWNALLGSVLLVLALILKMKFLP